MAELTVFMYHEIVGEARTEAALDKMTPSYYIPKEMFEKQMNILCESGFQSILLEEVSRLAVHDKYVALTFDDGWIGNYRHAWPILKEHGLKATFFVATELVGTPGFMSWSELGELSRNGISIQSHGVSHCPLHTLTDEEIYEELNGSKEAIEAKLGVEVSAVSFPHGSFDRRVVGIAEQVGYTTMCTSEVRINQIRPVGSRGRILGRIALTSGIKCGEFAKLLKHDRKAIWKRRLIKASKNTVKGMIGIENYRRLYRRYFCINDGP